MSPFFRAACKPEWMKPDDRVIKLPEEDVDAIQLMVYWMDSDEICFEEKLLKIQLCWGTDSTEAMSSYWGILAKLYVVGKKYGLPRLQNHCIDAMLQSRKKDALGICVGTIPYVYENTQNRDDPLRRLLITEFKYDCRKWALRYCRDTMEGFPEFLFDLATAFIDDKSNWEHHVKLEAPDKNFCKNFHKHDGLTHPCIQFHKFRVLNDPDGQADTQRQTVILD